MSSWTLAVQDGDIKILPGTGQPVQITGPQKTSQDLQETFQSDYDPTRNIGTALPSIIGTIPDSMAEPFVQNEVNKGVQRLIQLEQSDPNVDAYEQIGAIQQLNVTVQGFNVAFYVLCTTVAGDAVQAANIRNLKPIQELNQIEP